MGMGTHWMLDDRSSCLVVKALRMAVKTNN
jgi:hypothetical protein